MPSEITSPPSLLPNPAIIKQLSQAGLSPETLATVIIEDRRGKQTFAMVNSISGAACFVVVVSAFAYLVMHNHPTSAGLLLGTEALAIVRTMLGARI